ncbi:hypothetical protein [Sulfurimonas sp.]|uniref:hypothetical protein n=1 Tax=Sulfurimonas sp. TaxID=2022749 RepID=UPI003566A273
MYKKIIKESVSELNLLVIDTSENSKIFLTESISNFFNSITYISSMDKTIETYKNDKYDIVWFNIDDLKKYGLDVVNEIRKDNEMQPLIIFTPYTLEHNNLLVDLINLNIQGFINASITSKNELCKIMSSVWTKIYNRQLFMNYVEELENFQHDISSIQSSLVENINNDISQDEEEDFFFFPDTTEITTESHKEDDSIYKDYFNFLQIDDKEELVDLMNDMDAVMLDAFNGSDESLSSINKLGTIFMRFGNILMRYQFFSDIGTAIIELGNLVESKIHDIQAKADTLDMLIGGFCSGLHTFVDEVWEAESNNPKFFNDSIINDSSLIMEMIAPSVTTENQNDNNSDDLMFF